MKALGTTHHDGTALGALLLDRRERSLAGAIELASRSVGTLDVDMAEQVELEQRLDDLDRYDRLTRQLGAPAPQAMSPYQRNGRHSFLVDLAKSQLGDTEARWRVEAHRQVAAREQRTNMGAFTAGTGGEFVAPIWLLDDSIAQARANRPFLDAIGGRPLPGKGVSINVPKVTGGTSAAARATDITNPSSSSVTTGSSNAPLIEVAVKITTSVQLMELSPAGMDAMIFGELVEAAENEADRLALVGAGSSGEPNGLITAATGSTTFSGTTAAQFLAKLGAATSGASTARGKPVTHVLWHPRRRSWLAANGTADVKAGLDILGATLLDDGNVPVALGGGTNEDRVVCFNASDLRLWESDPTVLVATTSSTADTLSMTVVVRKRFAFLARYPAAVYVISGTGLNLVAT